LEIIADDPNGISHQDVIKETYECSYCEKTFLDKNYLKVHLLSHKEYQNIKIIDQGREKYGKEDVEPYDFIRETIDIKETDEEMLNGITYEKNSIEFDVVF
jgi:hypothetical protein